uniref:Ets variant 6 n=2 Tax=Nematostella vectensis TaxID=45351 RepID=A0A1C9KCZ4_NEMVE|nr:ets variant 6 [Nematostella vectensis]
MEKLKLEKSEAETPVLSSQLLEEWLSMPMTETRIATAAPIIATTITLEAIQNVLYASGYPIEAKNIDTDFGPFDDTQFDVVVDVETSSQEENTKNGFSKEFLNQCEDSLPDCSDISELSEDDVLSILNVSALSSDSEMDFSCDSGIEAEMDDMQESPKKAEPKHLKDADYKDTDKNSCNECGSELSKSTQKKKIKAKEGQAGSIDGCQYLWEFLHYLVTDKKYEKYIAWQNPQKGIFRMVDHNGVAKLWGKHKKRKNMTYDKLSRALRYYYSKDILAKVSGQRLTYKFCRTPSGRPYPS